VGEPGVGKTAIAEDTYRIVDGDVRITSGQNCIFIDMGALIAGAKYKENLKNVLNQW
jgi:ATP-dependent Clp protease ATP-binding subunit ClpA